MKPKDLTRQFFDRMEVHQKRTSPPMDENKLRNDQYRVVYLDMQRILREIKLVRKQYILQQMKESLREAEEDERRYQQELNMDDKEKKEDQE